MNDLEAEEAVGGHSRSNVISVTNASDRGRDARFGQPVVYFIDTYWLALSL